MFAINDGRTGQIPGDILVWLHLKNHWSLQFWKIWVFHCYLIHWNHTLWLKIIFRIFTKQYFHYVTGTRSLPTYHADYSFTNILHNMNTHTTELHVYWNNIGQRQGNNYEIHDRCQGNIHTAAIHEYSHLLHDIIFFWMRNFHIQPKLDSVLQISSYIYI
jgi:hypothetical protein